jgi:imidazolonepropionase-like amidohydrolase
MMRPLCGAAALCLAFGALSVDLPAQATGSGTALVVRAGSVIPVEGPTFGPGAVLIQDGLIRAVGNDVTVPEGATLVAFPGAVLMPGFVDGGTHLGMLRERSELTRPYLPRNRLADAFDSDDPRLARALESGITTANLLPSPEDVVGGRCAVIALQPAGGSRLMVADGLFAASLQGSAYPKSRAPTSPAGGVDLMVRGDGDAPPIEEFVGPGGGLLVATGSSAEIDLAARLRELLDVEPVIVAGPEVGELAAILAGKLPGVILRPLTPGLPPHARRAAADLEAAGIPVAFMSGAPASPPEALRLSAVVARRAGLSAAGVHRALTLTPARLLGISDRVGSLVPGKQGDLVVLSHDPADPRARVLLVVQDGRIVHRADDEK